MYLTTLHARILLAKFQSRLPGYFSAFHQSQDDADRLMLCLVGHFGVRLLESSTPLDGTAPASVHRFLWTSAACKMSSAVLFNRANNLFLLSKHFTL